MTDLKKVTAEEFLSILRIPAEVLIKNAETWRKDPKLFEVQKAGPNILLGEAIDRFKKNLIANKSRTTVITYGGIMDQYERFQNDRWDEQGITDRFVNKPTKADILTFLNLGRGRKCDLQTPTNYNKRLAIMNSFFKRYLVDDAELLEKSPTIGIRRKPEGDQGIQYLSKTEQSKVLEKSLNNREKRIGKRNYMMIYVDLNTGLRLEELLGLNVSDIDFEQGYINVIRGTKGNKPRTVALPDEVLSELRKYINTVRIREYDTPGVNPLFQNLKGHNSHQRIGRNAAGRMLNRIFRSCGISQGSWHRFRHTFAVSALQDGIKIPEIQIMLGHESIVNTMKYLKLSNEQILKKIREDHPLAFVSIKTLPDLVGGKLGDKLRKAIEGLEKHDD